MAIALSCSAASRSICFVIANCWWMDWAEHMGAYLKYGLYDEKVLLDSMGGPIARMWELCWPALELLRRRQAEVIGHRDGGDQLYENFEYLAVRNYLCHRGYPMGLYPKGTPRMRDLPGIFGELGRVIKRRERVKPNRSDVSHKDAKVRAESTEP